MLEIDNDKLSYIKEQVKKSYPHECCGLLVGINTSERRVVEVCPVQNKNFERAHDRYVIETRDFEKVDKEAAKKVFKSLVFIILILIIPPFHRYMILSRYAPTGSYHI